MVNLHCVFFDLQVEILDVDLHVCETSILRMMNVEGKTHYSSALFWVSHNKNKFIVSLVCNGVWMFLT